MTTVVADVKRKIVVSDSQYTDDDAGMKFFDEKVYRIPGGFFAGAGHLCDIEKVYKWLLDPKNVKKPIIKNDNAFLKLTDEGLVSSDRALVWETVKTYISIGSGAMASEAALRLGHTAEEAVYVATQIDLKSGGDVRVYELGKDGHSIYHQKS